MREGIVKITMLMFILFSVVTSCKKDDSNNVNPNAIPIVTSGTWTVSSYKETSEDHTDDFAGYTFTFESNGQMTATNSGNTTTGSWTLDDSENELHIDLGNNSPLDKLSKGWTILSITETEISLQDDSSSSNEVLQFTKS
jgi:hypothetical protein